ncbi:TonB-dependent SusC/RagA subfamily outer membrane receptor [Chryseobacterium sp. 52]|uniref:TonB-dependent receptor plug domain-containing protein n=1 Tax=Chryseobacterium sp. 52 TaxID=2035213 RepID=UPI000C19E55D|nr:TonB-dependent receptor plug domain-containing protein [Chryseobacterium sp. 52]PIF46380.1 TonB-dependent SusC/RagA subfamily outer membrane receptor [Chryseobacterium sp. 52]
MKITIPKPCHENWEIMTPEEKGKFCSVCSKTVRDFTGALDNEMIHFFSNSSENTCGRFSESQLNRDLQYSFINSLFAKFAVGFMLTAGGFVSVQAQQNEIHDTLKAEEIKDVMLLPAFSKQNNQKMLLGSTTVISGDLLTNPKQNEKAEMASKLSGVAFNQMPGNSLGKAEIRIGRASSTRSGDQKPLCIVNGKETNWEELRTMDPKVIKTINVLKDATAIYGAKAKHGVIMVTTKRKVKK